MHPIDQRDQNRPLSLPPIPSEEASASLEKLASLGEAPLAVKGVGQLFAEHVMPILAGCKNFSFDRNGGAVPHNLAQFLESPQNRAVAWIHLASNGLSGSMTQPQSHALVAGLRPHIAEEPDACWLAFASVTASAVAGRDERLYQALGEIALNHSPPPQVVFLLGGSFACLITHNARQDESLKPWIELFSKRGDGPLYAGLMGEMRQRLERGELSSYDHLLTVMCNSRSQEAVQAIAAAVNPPEYFLQESPVVRPSAALALSVYLSQTVKLLPASAVISFLAYGAGEVFSVNTLTIAAMAGVIGSFLKFRTLTSGVRAALEEEKSFVTGVPFLHFAERVYEKLSRLRDERPDLSEVLERMEAHPAFAPHIAKWRDSKVTA